MRVHSAALPLVSVLALVGAALGVHLGKSAVAEIDPIYYDEPETRFHADLSPYRSPTPGQDAASVSLASAPLPPGAVGDGCIGCRTYPEEYIPDRSGLDDSYAAGGWETADEAPAHYAAYEAAAEPDQRLAAIERYATYRVSHDEPERVRAPVAATAAAEPAEGETVALGM